MKRRDLLKAMLLSPLALLGIKSVEANSIPFEYGARFAKHSGTAFYLNDAIMMTEDQLDEFRKAGWIVEFSNEHWENFRSAS